LAGRVNRGFTARTPARLGAVQWRSAGPPEPGSVRESSGPHAQHAAEAPRRGPAPASAGAGRRGHRTRQGSARWIPHDRATGGRYPPGYRPPRCRRRSGCDCVCPCVAVPWSMVWRQRAGPQAPDGPRELTARELAVVRPCHGSRHPQVAGLLVVQAPVGWLVVPRDVDVAVADFEGKEYVDPFQGDRAVDVEEVHGEHG
jgi:hypothetical protein